MGVAWAAEGRPLISFAWRVRLKGERLTVTSDLTIMVICRRGSQSLRRT